MAPELCTPNSNIDVTKLPAIDIFALGATLYCMIVGRPPWMASNAIDLAAKIKNIELTFPDESIDPHLKYLLTRLLDKDYKTRITLDEVIVDDWVTLEGSDPLFNEVYSNDDLCSIDDPETLSALDDNDINHDEYDLNLNLDQTIDLLNDNSEIPNNQNENDRKDIKDGGNSPKLSLRMPTSTTNESRRLSGNFNDVSDEIRVLIIDNLPVLRQSLVGQVKLLGCRFHAVEKVTMAISEIAGQIDSRLVFYFFYFHNSNPQVSEIFFILLLKN